MDDERTPLIWANTTLVQCPACLGLLLSFRWSKAVNGDGFAVYELVGHCQPCNRYWVVGYSREAQ